MGQVSARWHDDDVIAGIFKGHVTAADVTELRRLTDALMDARVPLAVYIDTSAVTGFDPAVREPAVPWLRSMKEREVRRLLAVAPSSLVRMMGSAIAVASGLSLKFVAAADLEAALARERDAAAPSGR